MSAKMSVATKSAAGREAQKLPATMQAATRSGVASLPLVVRNT